MALAVEGARSVVLDDEYRIVEVSAGAEAALGLLRGRSILDAWEVLPRAEPVLGSHFRKARETGRPVAPTVFYAGCTRDLRIVPAEGSLTVHVRDRTRLDVRTLGTLGASLRRIEDELAAPELERPGRRALASRRALP